MSAAEAGALLADALTRRWYGANDRSVAAAEVLADEVVDEGLHLRWVLLGVRFTDGEQATYQLVVDDRTGEDALARPEVLRWLLPSLPVGTVAELGGEQSNTSLVVDGAVIVKVFRRLGEPGERNPDVEVTEALWAAGFRSVAEPMGHAERDGRDLAVATRYLARSSSGWQMALDDPYFMDEVRDLGVVTARMHVALAACFGSSPATPGPWVEAMRNQAARVPLPDGLDAAVAERYGAFADAADLGAAMRIHGDLHLGQVLHWRGDWYVLDFEGEPARPLAERVAPSSPLRDVAGMLRSFGYAAAVGGLPPVWEREARQRFWQGYRSVSEVAGLLPEAPEAVDALLAVFELDKAIYEVGYERASRPTWEHVPLAAVRRIVS
ncbi:MAG: hypothetical protein AB7O92_11435 [Acidimicrobiia bacterium]